MALFERPNHAHFEALLRQGFAARLRAETADTFLSQREKSVILTNDRKHASVFFFCGGDGPLTAVLLRPPQKGEPQFLSIGEKVAATDSPTLLKLALSDSNRQLFAISRVAPTEYLSLQNVTVGSLVTTKPKLTKWELFHLEVLPDTIGRGFVPGSFTNTKFMKPSQAISHALLELGVRFRLRSVHDRVLRVTDGVVRQDGPRSPFASTHEDEVLVTAFRKSDNSRDAKSSNYAVKEVLSGRFIKLHASTLKLVKDENVICLRASPNDWGTLSVGNQAEDGFQWLMAGPRGRLEFRKNPGAWETFTMEFVRQTYDAAIRELPVPGIYKVAETVTRDRLRQQVEAKVAEAKKTDAQRKVSGKTNFDHSRALAGLSDPTPKKGKKLKLDGSKKKGLTDKASEGIKSQSGAGAKGVRAGASASGLPRNKASKKASKKNRKKQKQQSSNRQAPSAKAQPSGNQPTPKSSKSESDRKAPEAESNTEEGSKSKAASSAASHEREASRGPPCAACGRSLSGTYTTALGKSFHPECFCCGRCRRPMGVGAGQFRERGGMPYCTSCYAAHLASRCARCSQPIMDTVVTAMDKTWHKDCLTCTICRLPLTQTFWLYADKPNEPRCSRCVTGDENYSRAGGSRRMVNLPMFGTSNNTPSFPMNGPTGSSGVVGASSKGGRARLMAPILPPTTKK